MKATEAGKGTAAGAAAKGAAEGAAEGATEGVAERAAERAAAAAMEAEAATRATALDPVRSFIVEAPAGSGKTELLTQRFLRLLATVELPEQIVAITFTRKAAAEMRQRVVDTLRAAANGTPELPPHRQASLTLARAVLERAGAKSWALLEQSQRLRILTIDALNTSLARQLPVLTSGIVSLELTEDADSLYRRAARGTLEALADDSSLGDSLRPRCGPWPAGAAMAGCV